MAVIHVYMAVDEIGRFMLIHKVQKALKALMGMVLPITAAFGGGMGEKDIHAAGLLYLPLHPAKPPLHLPLGVLVLFTAVEHAAAHTQYTKAIYIYKPILYTVAALRRPNLVTGVMVAVNIEKGRSAHGHKKAEIFCLQITAGEHKVNIVQAAGRIVIPEKGAFFI